MIWNFLLVGCIGWLLAQGFCWSHWAWSVVFLDELFAGWIEVCSRGAKQLQGSSVQKTMLSCNCKCFDFSVSSFLYSLFHLRSASCWSSWKTSISSVLCLSRMCSAAAEYAGFEKSHFSSSAQPKYPIWVYMQTEWAPWIQLWFSLWSYCFDISSWFYKLSWQHLVADVKTSVSAASPLLSGLFLPSLAFGRQLSPYLIAVYYTCFQTSFPNLPSWLPGSCISQSSRFYQLILWFDFHVCFQAVSDLLSFLIEMLVWYFVVCSFGPEETESAIP